MRWQMEAAQEAVTRCIETSFVVGLWFAMSAVGAVSMFMAPPPPPPEAAVAAQAAQAAAAPGSVAAAAAAAQGALGSMYGLPQAALQPQAMPTTGARALPPMVGEQAGVEGKNGQVSKRNGTAGAGAAVFVPPTGKGAPRQRRPK